MFLVYVEIGEKLQENCLRCARPPLPLVACGVRGLGPQEMLAPLRAAQARVLNALLPVAGAVYATLGRTFPPPASNCLQFPLGGQPSQQPALAWGGAGTLGSERSDQSQTVEDSRDTEPLSVDILLMVRRLSHHARAVQPGRCVESWFSRLRCHAAFQPLGTHPATFRPRLLRKGALHILGSAFGRMHRCGLPLCLLSNAHPRKVAYQLYGLHDCTICAL